MLGGAGEVPGVRPALLSPCAAPTNLKRGPRRTGMVWLAYAVACALFHHVLAYHYQDACRPSWWSFGEGTAYCSIVNRALQLLRAGPLLAALPALPRAPHAHHPA